MIESRIQPMPKMPVDRRWTALSLALLAAFYLLATLPHLADFPLLDWPQMGIAAPAWKLANEGVYGNDLFAGFHRSELRNYEYMPAYPLLVALSFELLGLGVFEARLVSVICGWLTVMLTFYLGRQLLGTAAGLAAAAVLCTVRLGLLPQTSGVPLLDFARIIRYDILVPVGVLAAASCFLRAAGESPPPGRSSRGALFVLAGALAGLATLTHVYGAFILAVFAAVLLWHRGWRGLREAPLYLLAVGWLLALLPWIAYALQDFEAYVGQMSRHEGRFDLLDPGFYWNNLRRELWRYTPWLKGGFPATLLQPRMGIWLVLLGLPASMALLWRRLRVAGRLEDRFLLLSVPVLELCLGLLMVMKRHVYTVLVLPFIALLLGILIVEPWRRVGDLRVGDRRFADRRIGDRRFAASRVVDRPVADRRVADRRVADRRVADRRVADRGVAGRRASIRRAWRGLVAILGVLVLIESGMGVSRALAAARGTSPYLELCGEIARPIPTGARLLISQPYWLGLEKLGDFELRSVNLVFQLAKTMTVDEAMARLAPDHVVIESYFLAREPDDGRGPPPGSEAKRTFLELRAHLERFCSGEVREHPDPDYGTVAVYRCR